MPPHYDSLIAKVIAHGGDRDEALRTLLAALDSSHIEGVHTTLELQRSILASDDFRRGSYDTRALPGRKAALRA